MACSVAVTLLSPLSLHRSKQASYGGVLEVLDAELAAPVYRLLPRQLAGVVDPARSAVFDQIKY